MPDSELPQEILQETERLTRLARDAIDPGERETYLSARDELVEPYDFVARHREEDDVLVLHPAEWVDDEGTVRPSQIDDVDRGIERPLSGTGEDYEWSAVEEHNAAVVEAVADEHGDDHAANARAFADFLGNHYVRRIETAGAPEVREFVKEYYPRNAWLTAEQRSLLSDSLEFVFDAVDAELPEYE
ncbi:MULTISPECIES: rnhA operon protein [Haloferax]|uniref:RnhA operon protein n=1 Tax=Haloferax marinum TaxID=2666143 RepID=A0A6A8G4B9_9EURY|nr:MULTISPECIES: rnhA operon protein [Haloferax]KAB1197044.1 rnhA operon protein [Haloferax sp. CBA1150]MRW96070.1 rnhA operon protein [Haloferax marinum]